MRPTLSPYIYTSTISVCLYLPPLLSSFFHALTAWCVASANCNCAFQQAVAAQLDQMRDQLPLVTIMSRTWCEGHSDLEYGNSKKHILQTSGESLVSWYLSMSGAGQRIAAVARPIRWKCATVISQSRNFAEILDELECQDGPNAASGMDQEKWLVGEWSTPKK